MHQFCLFLKMWGRKYSFDTVNHQSSCPIWSKMCSLMTKVATCHQTDLVGCWITRLSMGFMSYHHTYFVVVAPKLQFLIQSNSKSLIIHHLICWTLMIWMIAHRYYHWLDFWGPRFMGCASKESISYTIIVRFLVLFPDVMFSYNSKMKFFSMFSM